VAEADLRFADALPPNAETIWQEGTPAQRLAILTKLRETNPAQARDWLIATWKAERADTRATLLGTLETNLSIEDEAFLDAALDDKSEKVRNKAIPLLARLPNSAFAARMRARAETLFVHGAARGHDALSTDVPATAADPLWRRDTNNRELSSDDPVSYRRSYVKHTLALIPPSYWSGSFDAPPAAVLAAVEHASDADQVLKGLTHAILLFRDVAWADALWDYRLRMTQHDASRQPPQAEMLRLLLALLPAAATEERLQPLFQQGPDLPAEPWSGIVADLPTPWSASFSLVCLEGLREFAQVRTFDAQFHHGFWSQSIDIVARSISPSCLSQALQIADLVADQVAGATSPADWQVRVRDEALDRFAATIRLRRRIHQVFAP
jgi:hypothetical protein